jgi:hypothetical protein
VEHAYGGNNGHVQCINLETRNATLTEQIFCVGHCRLQKVDRSYFPVFTDNIQTEPNMLLYIMTTRRTNKTIKVANAACVFANPNKETQRNNTTVVC